MKEPGLINWNTFLFGAAAGSGLMFSCIIALEPRLLFLLWLKFRIMLLAIGITELEEYFRGG